MIYYPKYIVNACLSDKGLINVYPREDKNVTFNPKPFEWDEYDTELGDASICVTKV